MVKLRKQGFTLIELIAVLVIMAILALIVTPLVMNIIRKARIAADKRSIDAYGRSIELAIAGYLLDNGKFPTSVDQLTVEYSGNEVVCSTTQLNSDSSVYLTDCTVGGRTVDYEYRTLRRKPTYKAYTVGDTVTYNNISYYVIANSGTNEESVTLLKEEPLTVQEVNDYGTGQVNRYTSSSVGTAYDSNGYGGMAYYSSENCRYDAQEAELIDDGCKSSYASSDIKYVVDGWKIAKAPAATEARLITKQELITNLGYRLKENATGEQYTTNNVLNWVYNSNYWYWTISSSGDSSSYVWRVDSNGGLSTCTTGNGYDGTVRPVIVLPKSALSN